MAEIESMDGFAACNLAEPSPGDLERVYKAYKNCFWRLDQLTKAERLLRMWVTFYNMRTLVASSSIRHRDALTKQTDEFLDSLSKSAKETK